jgi:hypothetical protein
MGGMIYRLSGIKRIQIQFNTEAVPMSVGMGWKHINLLISFQDNMPQYREKAKFNLFVAR